MAQQMELAIEEMREAMLFRHERDIARIRELGVQVAACDLETQREIDQLIAGLQSRRVPIVAALQRLGEMVASYPPPPLPQPVAPRAVQHDNNIEEFEYDHFASLSTEAA